MAGKNISNQEVKGTRDWFPEEFNVRKYIFDKWRQVCLSYGFSEYLSPLLETATKISTQTIILTDTYGNEWEIKMQDYINAKKPIVACTDDFFSCQRRIQLRGSQWSNPCIYRA